jgi:DNA-binding FrmR family transcriptional regulator
MPRARNHQTHPDVVKRLKRALGQLRSICEMIEAGRPCLQVAQQLQAAASAVHEAKKTYIHGHLNHCLEAAVGSDARKARAQLIDFKAIAKSV